MTMTELIAAPSTTDSGDRTNGEINNASAELVERHPVNGHSSNHHRTDDAAASDSLADPPNRTTRSSWTNIANNDENDMVRNWKESPFAVGLTYPTWEEEPVRCCNDEWCFKPVNITAICCRYCCVGRVGNMVVLLQQNVPATDPITSSTVSHRPKLMIVLGPYWMVLVFVTIPIFALLSAYTFFRVTRHQESTTLFILHLITTFGLFVSLLMVGCQDPGILYRHNVPPNSSEATEWQWNDQALTYRPLHAKYDSECAVVIEQFDHTCPWTGTAIGKKNMFWFRIFVAFVLLDILFNSIVLTLL
jgi:DHHC palmitoyltransferase